MSEGTNPNGGPGTDPKSGAPSAETLAADLARAKEELEAEKTRANQNASDYRKAKDRVTDLENQIRERERADADKNGDKDKLRETYQREVDDAKRVADELRKQLHSVVIEKEVRSLAAEMFVDAEDVWQLTKDNFEVKVDEKTGAVTPVVTNSTLSVKDFLAKFADKKPHLAKNKAANGAGGGRTENGGGTAGNGGPPADFASWSKDKQREWFAKNKDFRPTS